VIRRYVSPDASGTLWLNLTVGQVPVTFESSADEAEVADLSLRIEQGYEVGRPSLVRLRARTVGRSREISVGGR
jgi:predicted PhzF superfamily epimerase YddE/YHI9